MRRDYRPGLLEGAQFQRDRGSGHFPLPLVGQGEVPGPVEPVLVRSLLELPSRRLERGAERLVLPEHQGEGAVQGEARLMLDVGQRGVGRETHDGLVARVADMVGADGDVGYRFAVAVGRPHPDRDPRQPADRLDPPDDLRRAKDALVLLEARHEVGDADGAALAVLEHRLHHRGVADVARARLDLIGQDDIREPLFLVAGQQPREDRIGVEPRRAPPDDSRVGIDQSRNPAVADEGVIEVPLAAHAVTVSERVICFSHPRTAAGSGKVPDTFGAGQPTA